MQEIGSVTRLPNYALKFPIHRNNHIVPLPTIDLNKKDLSPCLPNRR
jgi:hypothetical protein